MAKGLSKQRVIETALKLIDETGTKINFRDIARELNCAHTNLYNYFDSFDALLWEAQEAIMRQLQSSIDDNTARETEPETKLAAFFHSFVDFYLKHKGWFYLSWFEPLRSPRPKTHYDLAVSTVNAMLNTLKDISRQMNHSPVSEDEMKFYLHNVHSYIIGELSIFFSGRSLIQDETQFKDYVNMYAVMILKAFLDKSQSKNTALPLRLL